jgi:hypothetical protein
MEESSLSGKLWAHDLPEPFYHGSGRIARKQKGSSINYNLHREAIPVCDKITETIRDFRYTQIRADPLRGKPGYPGKV